MTSTTAKLIRTLLKSDPDITPQQIVEATAILEGKRAKTAEAAAILLTQNEAARLLNCSRFTIRRLEKQGKIKPVYLTRDLKRYRRTELEAIAAGV